MLHINILLFKKSQLSQIGVTDSNHLYPSRTTDHLSDSSVEQTQHFAVSQLSHVPFSLLGGDVMAGFCQWSPRGDIVFFLD